MAFQVALQRAFEDLGANDIDSVGYVTMYFRPFHEGRELDLYDDSGNFIEELILDDLQAKRTYRSTKAGMTYHAKEGFKDIDGP